MCHSIPRWAGAPDLDGWQIAQCVDQLLRRLMAELHLFAGTPIDITDPNVQAGFTDQTPASRSAMLQLAVCRSDLGTGLFPQTTCKLKSILAALFGIWRAT